MIWSNETLQIQANYLKNKKELGMEKANRILEDELKQQLNEGIYSWIRI